MEIKYLKARIAKLEQWIRQLAKETPHKWVKESAKEVLKDD